MVDGEELLDMMNELEMSVGDISVENVRSKSERELNQKQPFDNDINDMEATPTKSHDYVSNCPACSEINSLWVTRHTKDGPEILKCEACGDMLSKTETSDGLFQGSSMKWKLYSNHSELDGEAKTAKEWREY
jgi:DNA-directed RNA polymerase subunit M/transcription elongation factor TFIIS